MPRLVILLLLALPLLAQPPRGFFNWWDSPIAKDLNLSDDQTRQIRGIVKEYRLKLIDQRAAVQKAEAEMEDVFNEDALDQRRANDSIERLITARGDLTRSFTQMSLRLRSVLTADQYRELQKRRPAGPNPEVMRERLQLRQQRRQGPPPPPPQQQ